MPDPKLQAAMEEIKAVLTKHDIAGIILLESQKYAEYYYELSPTWSCAKIEGDQLHIRAKREHFPSDVAQAKCLTETIGMIVGFGDMTARTLDAVTKTIKMIGEHFDVVHQTRAEPPPEK